MQKLINWCKDNWLLIASCFLLAFIPLYPKLPLINVIRTFVYIRLEDFAVALVGALFMLMLWRKKLFPKTDLTWPIIIYWVVGFISLTSSLIFFTHKLQGYFPHLVLLNYLRRIEYMLLFFFGYYAVVKKPKALHAVIWTLALTTVGIIIYGWGQKFYGFPAYLTMNEQFAKGIPLRLPPTARIASTFGGHYDLAAFMVFVIPILGSLVFGVKKLWQKIGLTILSALSLMMLLFTASRISFGVYLISISVMLIWRKKAWLILPVIILSFVMLNFVSTASSRFYKTLQFSNVVIDLSTGQPIGTVDEVQNGKNVSVSKPQSPAEEQLPRGSAFLGVPPTTPVAPTKTLKTIEIYTSSSLATGSGEIATVSGSFLIQKAFVYDISITTRLQAEWPNAIAAFKRNILLGSGYSTISVATDGDYHRMLGETGILGMVSFLGIFCMAFYLYFRGRSKLDRLSETFVTGVFAGIIGLSVNAILIDVFESSKVAYTMWLILGVAIALLAESSIKRLSYGKVMWNVLTSKVLMSLYVFIGVLILYGRSISMYFVADDFTWLRWASSSTFSDLPKYFTSAAGFFYRPIPKLLYFALYTVFWLKPEAYHIASLLLLTTIAIVMALILEARGVRRWIAFGAAFVCVALSVHHENVIWISGMSSLLSATFLFLALLWMHPTRYKHPVMVRIQRFGVWCLALLSAMSYEGGMIAPVIVWYVSWFVLQEQSIGSFGVLLLVPLYWAIRTHAHAVPPSGDYNVKASTFIVNTVGNSIGYVVAILFGPRAIDIMTSLRLSLRTHLVPVLAGTVGVVVVSVWAAVTKVRVHMSAYKESLVWVGAAGISALPFLGLGGMAERYALVPSVFLIMAVAVAVDAFWKQDRSILKLGTVAVLALLVVWNIAELGFVMNDWQKASDVSETTILSLKANFFPLQNTQSFVFVNTPIRYGRAWIFPTGLRDAMWQMFKFNSYSWIVNTAPDVKSAFAVHTQQGEPIVLVFDKNMKLTRAAHIIQTIEEKKP